VVIIRCDPRILSERNAARGWPASKVEENSEWELLGGAWSEREEWVGLPVLELESTDVSPASLFEAICGWVSVAFKPDSPERPIDWVERIHG
jgi:broad-specificity NMP kinase